MSDKSTISEMADHLINEMSDNDKFLLLCRDGRLDEVKEMVASGRIDPKKIRGPHLDTPLHESVKSQSIPMIDFFLDLGLHINMGNMYDTTPLYFACIGKDKDPKVVEHLLSKGADTRVKSGFSGWTCLKATEQYEHHESYKLIESEYNKHIASLKCRHILNRYAYYNGWRMTIEYMSFARDEIRQKMMDGFFPEPDALELLKSDKYKEYFDRCNELNVEVRKLISEYNEGKVIFKVCLWCGKDKRLSLCSRCRDVRFCGTNCQSSMWRVHKHFCSKPYPDG